jgi:hypothetical protein
MATIKTFKELDAWKKSVNLTRQIYLISGFLRYLRSAGISGNKFNRA